MPRVNRVKRELLREVVRENLETMRGLPPRSLRRSRRWGRFAVRRVPLVVLATLLVLVSVKALSTGGDRLPEAKPALAALIAPPIFPAPQPINPVAFSLGVRKIVLDPGHGGDDPGARTVHGVWEKDLTLDIARRLRKLLEKAGLEIEMTRERDETVPLRGRAGFANAAKADLFVSIHVNSLHLNSTPARQHRGVETYYLGPTKDPYIEQLASFENRDSGYSLADFRRLLDGVFAHVRQRESRTFATVVHGQLLRELGKANPALRDNGVKTAPFAVLVATEMPGLLAEVSYLSNDEEGKLLADPVYRQNIAQGLFEGIRAYADTMNRPAGPRPVAKSVALKGAAR